MMKITLVVLACLFFVTDADAKARNRAQAASHRLSDQAAAKWPAWQNSGYGQRPAKWCGWWLRTQVWNDPGAAFNVARAWSKWGSPAPGPAPGVIGVQRHHVFKVVEVIDRRTVLAISGNDRNAVRTRPRSIKGVIAWRN